MVLSLPLCLSCVLLVHSIPSLIPCPQHFYSSVLYLFHLLLYLLILPLHLILFLFPALPLNYLLNLFSLLLFPHVIIFAPPQSAPWNNSGYEKKKPRTIVIRPDVWTSAFICTLIFGHTQNVPSCCTKPLKQSTNPCSACPEYIHA